MQADVSFWITGKSKDEIKFLKRLLNPKEIVSYSVATMSSTSSRFRGSIKDGSPGTIFLKIEINVLLLLKRKFWFAGIDFYGRDPCS